ncbi:putative F-box protein PP2-B12 [Elaeis guineensis]|uniref:F-box protein At2g02240-like n=1 Tax=Elaeis guineensis var. tenera TaxID=51953 RepID=A0A6J0PPS4_ELAGV|nr:F-box protein At2g02240-like [Elaeis guineensis]XP_029123585.1 F-box protein At2g02240-like [Elaeis guineensis]
MGTSCGDICTLPEGCISHVISLTSPVDSCRSAAVCTTFRSAAESDIVWERFLPPDYPSILSRAVHPVEYLSKKQLFFRLCETILIDDGNMSFSLDKSSGAKCYMLSGRQLFIVWGDTPHYWTWHPLPDSRFSEVAELVDVCWLEIRGKIESSILTPKTTYAAYLIFKVDQNSHGLGFLNQETTVKLGAQVSTHTVNVQPIVAERQRNGHRWHFLNSSWNAILEGHADAEQNEIAARAPQERADGWMEMEMGEFYNDEGEDGEVEMSLMEVKRLNWKSGLIIQGIEIRPKK